MGRAIHDLRWLEQVGNNAGSKWNGGSGISMRGRLTGPTPTPTERQMPFVRRLGNRAAISCSQTAKNAAQIGSPGRSLEGSPEGSNRC